MDPKHWIMTRNWVYPQMDLAVIMHSHRYFFIQTITLFFHSHLWNRYISVQYRDPVKQMWRDDRCQNTSLQLRGAQSAVFSIQWDFTHQGINCGPVLQTEGGMQSLLSWPGTLPACARKGEKIRREFYVPTLHLRPKDDAGPSQNAD